MKSVFLLVFATMLLGEVLCGGTSTKSIVAARTTAPIRIDGLLTEAEWAHAVPVGGFLQYDPEEGANGTEETSVRILYDDNSLYVGVMCFDRDPANIVSLLTRRDRTTQTDRISVIIDSYHDHSTAFLFNGAVSGVQSDGILSHDGKVYDVQWDAVWQFDAKIVPQGWSAEFKIPYSALRFAQQDSEYVWGINFRRYIARKNETDEWVMVPRKEEALGTISSVSKMGHVSGIMNIAPPLKVEVLPYQLSKLNSFAQPAPFSTLTEFKGTAGMDLKFGITNNFMFDMAINPDFGQVEVDQAVLNLTVFETQYPEKRPLFLEGNQFFTFGNGFDNLPLQLFYSRRIGKKPDLTFAADSGYRFIKNPPSTSILSAMKLTGRTDNGFSLGALTAFTNQEDALEEDVNGKQLPSMMIEPRGSYNVVRVKQEIFGQSSVGMMATSTFKDGHTPSLSGGTDWNFSINNGLYLLDGYLAGSRFSPLPGIIRTGGAGRFGFAKSEGEHWLGFTAYDFAANDFSINDIGFYGQAHEHGGYTEIAYKEDHAAEPVRHYALVFQTNYRWNWDGISTVKQVEAQPTWIFRNFWSLSFDYLHPFRAYDDANRGITGLYRRPEGNQLTMTLSSDSRQPVQFALGGGYISDTRNLGAGSASLSLTLRPNTWIELNPALSLTRSRNEEAWVVSWTRYYYASDGNNLFGRRDLDQYNFSLRGTVTFTRSLSLQFFTQVFLAKAHYEQFRKLVGAENLPLYDYLHSPSYSNPDFNAKIFNANLVLRWEYLPGSTFYLVWTQNRSGDEPFYEHTLSENLSNAFRLPMDNVILAKISYWWSL